MKESIKYIFRRLGFATKVNTFIIGAEKCGTTSLHEALCSHSRCIEAPFKKELHFWSNGPGPNSLAEYESQFPFLSAKFRLLDSTPNYMFETSVVSRIHRYNPDAKFIVLLRNPIKRAFSAWSMYHPAFQKGALWRGIAVHDPRGFEGAIHEEMVAQENAPIKKNYLAMGHYANQLRPIMKIIPPENLLIAIVEEDVYPNEAAFLARCQSFLEIPFESLTLPKSNPSQNPKTLSQYPASFLELLSTHFDSHNDDLRELLGRDLKGWR